MSLAMFFYAGEASFQILHCSNFIVFCSTTASKVQARTWKIPKTETASAKHARMSNDVTLGDKTNVATMVAETIYICRPIIYLCTRYHYPSESYRPWAAAFTSELARRVIIVPIYDYRETPKSNFFTFHIRKLPTV